MHQNYQGLIQRKKSSAEGVQINFMSIKHAQSSLGGGGCWKPLRRSMAESRLFYRRNKHNVHCLFSLLIIRESIVKTFNYKNSLKGVAQCNSDDSQPIYIKFSLQNKGTFFLFFLYFEIKHAIKYQFRFKLPKHIISFRPDLLYAYKTFKISIYSNSHDMSGRLPISERNSCSPTFEKYNLKI